uniref:Col_cuticle_N domain-containing protein n=1 Tax=Heterorhabditis bacteriophora TaxID=37862 RepID=A0A1I7WGJ4_HETBA
MPFSPTICWCQAQYTQESVPNRQRATESLITNLKARNMQLTLIALVYTGVFFYIIIATANTVKTTFERLKLVSKDMRNLIESRGRHLTRKAFG